ncbi:hypothetical protein MRB53_037921 [Persea americana]|nr:hypothetical protein MRB53_037921 [Persea americana]
MPYTPPAQQSPAASRNATPSMSRAHTYFTSQPSPPRSPGFRPRLPRSAGAAAYVKTRRVPTIQTNGLGYHVNGFTTAQPDGFTSNEDKAGSISSSLRQSPPPISDSDIPAGAVLSPPDSTQNSSDDEELSMAQRVESGEFAELQDAVRETMHEAKGGSPSEPDDLEDEIEPEKGGVSVNGAAADIDKLRLHRPGKLTEEARKISHSRSTTESSIFESSRGYQFPSTGSEEDDETDDENDRLPKPPLVRKKSGELVKPAIRPSHGRKPSSAPGTPTFSKAVHFNEDIEQVRHFLQVDRPIAVSAGGSPAENYEEEAEFPFGRAAGDSAPTYDVRLGNFPHNQDRAQLGVRVERLALSPDQKSLLGMVAVANWGFQKFVVARFTFDYWKTTSEIFAEYSNEVRQRPRDDGYDQFNFNIKLADQTNLETKTLLICVRYNVNGQEFWDSNNGNNFQVDFVRKARPADKASTRGGHAAAQVPRSKHNSPATRRQRPAASFDDDFADGFGSNHLRFRNGASASTFPETPPPVRRQAPTAQAFGSRYDFGASLTAALSQAQASMGDRSGVKHKRPVFQRDDSFSDAKERIPSARLAVPSATANGTESPRPDALLATKQSVDSRAYQEFVNKFCFVRSPGSSTTGVS